MVTADGTGDAPTIQSAVSQAANGDIIEIGPGTYHEDIFIAGKDITLEGQQGYSATILDGSLEDSSVVVIREVDFHRIVLRNLTITGGRGTTPPGGSSRGGGIYAIGYFELWIENCRIAGNSAESGGAGRIRGDIALPYPSIPECYLIDNVIEDNQATSNAGGFSFSISSAKEIRGNVFRNNFSPFDAGAINVQSDVGSTWIHHNMFVGNEALDKGGAIQLGTTGLANSPVIEFNLFYGNMAFGRDGDDLGTGAAILLATEVGGVVRNNTVAFNDGRGAKGCSGGAFAFFSMNSPLEIRENIFSDNLGCALACYAMSDPNQVIMGQNLYWNNSHGNINQSTLDCPDDWQATIVEGNPLFCGPEVNDYTCREDSPALTGSTLFGAFLDPGCSAPTAVELTTWGAIKSRFGSASN